MSQVMPLALCPSRSESPMKPWQASDQLTAPAFFCVYIRSDDDNSPENLRNWILETPVSDLHVVMGSVYQVAVRKRLFEAAVTWRLMVRSR